MGNPAYPGGFNVAPEPPQKIKMICAKCGSEDVTRDGFLKWSVEKQAWDVVGELDHADCNSCGEEVDLILRFFEAEPMAATEVVTRDIEAVKKGTHILRDIFNDSKVVDAAIARIEGEWDNPALLALGPLSVDTLADVLKILRGAQEQRPLSS